MNEVLVKKKGKEEEKKKKKKKEKVSRLLGFIVGGISCDIASAAPVSGARTGEWTVCYMTTTLTCLLFALVRTVRLDVHSNPLRLIRDVEVGGGSGGGEGYLCPTHHTIC